MKSTADKIVELLEQDPGVIGLFATNRGVSVPEEPEEYAKSRLGLATVYEVREELFERFGLRVGITTIYRVWRPGARRRR